MTISIEELQAQAEQGRYEHCGRPWCWLCSAWNHCHHTIYLSCSLSVEQPSCTAMTKKYRARPWFGREVLDFTMVRQSSSYWKLHSMLYMCFTWLSGNTWYIHVTPDFWDIYASLCVKWTTELIFFLCPLKELVQSAQICKRWCHKLQPFIR